jgi:1-deoxy-D-xylulose-5-phosphate reductoisomerase
MIDAVETAPPRHVVVLGSTGSVGRQTLDVIRANPDRWTVVGLAAGRDEESLRRQAAEFSVRKTGLGADAAIELAAHPEAEIVVNGIVGAAGLRASVAALGSGKVLALANKESLVAGGDACLAAARRGGGTIVPVDSEHAAIGQVLGGRAGDSVRRIILTASGGPFRNRPRLDDVKPHEALKHPTWSMGPKITIDSATLMNKGLEVIEAHYVFGMDYDAIDIVVHPQSIVHGIVEFVDSSMVMQAAPTDMRIPIQAALAYPERLEWPEERIDLEKVGALDFEPLDHARFPSVGLAYESGRKGKTFPAVLNAANEEAVNAFLIGLIGFTAIPAVVEDVLEKHDPAEAMDLEAVLEADGWARSEARKSIRAHAVEGER